MSETTDGGTTDFSTAIARAVSSTLADCELSFLEREPIDVERAAAQHREYCDTLASVGVHTVVLPADSDLPDCVFVEDTAIALDELAVVTHPGAASRRPEVVLMADALRRHRTVEFMQGPGTLDGGDVLRLGRTLYVGLTARTTAEGVADLRAIVEPHGYRVTTVAVDGCLHMKSACGYVGRDTVLVNREWIDADVFEGVTLVDVASAEPWAANAIAVRGVTLVSAAYPETAVLLSRRGFEVKALDVSELHKAEGGLSCLSVLLR